MAFKSPCKDCPDRHVGCHGTCEKYIEAKAVHEQLLEQQRKAAKAQYDIDGFESKTRHRLYRIHKQ